MDEELRSSLLRLVRQKFAGYSNVLLLADDIVHDAYLRLRSSKSYAPVKENYGYLSVVCIRLPAATYVVFSSPPSDAAGLSAAIQGTWQYIFNEWFPDSGYEYAQGCVDFEYYDAQSMGENNNVCDIYIPVSKRG